MEEVSTPLEISQTLDSDKTLPKTLLIFLSKTRPEVKNVDFFHALQPLCLMSFVLLHFSFENFRSDQIS